jgi:TetR/AcrR family transcriptional repressor of nem operon
MVESDASTEPRLTAKGRATRARIVGVAAELIEQRGVAGTGIDDVRRAAAVSGSQMSHYFGDKASLVRAVVAHQADAVIAAQRPRLEHMDSLDGIRAWTDAVVAKNERLRCEGGCEFGSLASELAETDAVTRAGLADGFLRWEGMIRDGLAAMQDRGELAPEADPQALAFALLSAQQGGVLLAQTLRDPAPLRAALDAVLAHVASFAVERQPGAGR